MLFTDTRLSWKGNPALRTHFLVTVVLLAIGLQVGCSSSPTTPEGRAVAFFQRSKVFPVWIPTPGPQFFGTEAEFAQYWEELFAHPLAITSQPPPPLPNVDFTTASIVVIPPSADGFLPELDQITMEQRADEVRVEYLDRLAGTNCDFDEGDIVLAILVLQTEKIAAPVTFVPDTRRLPCELENLAEFQVLFEQDFHDFRTPYEQTFTDQASFETFWNDAFNEVFVGIPPLPEVNFAESSVTVIGGGLLPFSLDPLRLHSILRDGSRLTIAYQVEGNQCDPVSSVESVALPSRLAPILVVEHTRHEGQFEYRRIVNAVPCPPPSIAL